MRPMMLQRQLQETAEPFRRVLAYGPPAETVPLLQQAAPVIRGPEATIRLIEPLAAATDGAARLEPLLAAFRRRGVRIVREQTATADAPALLEEVRRERYELLLKARPPDPAGGRLVHEDERPLIAACACPVWFGDRSSSEPPRRIVASVDPRPDDEQAGRLSRQVLTVAIRIAEYAGSELHVLHTWVPFGAHLVYDWGGREEARPYVQHARKAAHRAVDELLASVPVTVPLRREHVHVVRGEFEIEVPRLVTTRGIDLVVIGTTGRRAPLARALVKPHALDLVERVTCSAVIVKT